MLHEGEKSLAFYVHFSKWPKPFNVTRREIREFLQPTWQINVKRRQKGVIVWVMAQIRQTVEIIRRLRARRGKKSPSRSEEHTSELQSRQYLVCRLLLEKKKKQTHYLTPL